jgi:hypothetical protein
MLQRALREGKAEKAAKQPEGNTGRTTAEGRRRKRRSNEKRR